MTNEKKLKLKKTLSLIGALTVSAVFGVCAILSTPKTDIKTVKALSDPTYPYIYNLKPSTGAINLNWIGDANNNIVYVGGEKYENVKTVRIQGSLGKTELLGSQDITLENTQDIMIVPNSSMDASDMPGSDRFTRYTYKEWALEFINNPNFIDTFANQNYQGIPITSVAYSPSEYTVYSGLFYSNGTKYSTIKIRLVALNGTEWLVDNKAIAFSTSSHSELRNMCYVAYVKYDNTTVYQIDGVNDSGDYYLTTSYRWTNSNYKNIKFYADYLNPNYPNYPTSSFQEMFEDYNYGRMIVVDDSLKDAFNVIALAITSILPMLNFKIASDITLGTLILVPLTLGIILAIIKLFKR